MNWTLNDYSALAVFALLLCMACFAIGYLVGRYHGREEGRLTGEVEARHTLIPRVMAAKRDGQRAGRILGMREAICLMFRVSKPSDNTLVAPLRKQKPA